MSTFALFPCDLQVPCDTFQCHNRAKFFIGREDAPKSTLTKVCEKCANELIESVMEFRGDAVEVNGDPLPVTDDPMTGVQLPFEDPGITIDGKPIEELSTLELKRACKNLGITGYSDKKRDELVSLIEEATNIVIEANL